MACRVIPVFPSPASLERGQGSEVSKAERPELDPPHSGTGLRRAAITRSSSVPPLLDGEPLKDTGSIAVRNTRRTAEERRRPDRRADRNYPQILCGSSNYEVIGQKNFHRKLRAEQEALALSCLKLAQPMLQRESCDRIVVENMPLRRGELFSDR